MIFTETSIEDGRIKLVLWTKPLRQMMRLCKCFPHVSEIPTLTYNRAYSIIIKNAKILNIIHVDIFNLHHAEVIIYDNISSIKVEIK
jgi:hypothetical protein